MRKCVLLVVVSMLLCATSSFAIDGQHYFRFNIQSFKELPQLTKLMSIDNVRGDTVWAYANDEQFADFEKSGYTIEVLPAPSSLREHRMAKGLAEMQAWDAYPTYGTYVDMMVGYAQSFPSLCILDTIGYSGQGKLLIAVCISDNVSTEEAEAEVFYTSTMHGDETTGYMLTLRLIDYLLNNYGSESRVTNLVDNLEIWINPLANPDGTYRTDTTTINSATRYNANGVDLNRNFPDPEDGQHPDGYSWQAETVAMMDFAEENNFVLSANYHGGAEVLNYPWDTWSQRHADDAWFIDFCRRYADTVHANAPSGYLTDYNNGITNGYDWYTISGGRQDYMTYFMGGREVTIEISSDKDPPGSQMPLYWGYNRSAMLGYIETALWGVKGIVSDSVTGLPLAAVVSVLNHDIDSARVFTDPVVGDYHRMLAPGVYSLYFKAPGYVAKTISNVVVTAETVTPLDVELAPLTGDPVISLYDYAMGYVDPGDTIDFYITLINDGGGNGNNVTADLSSSDGNITILQNTSAYPTISAEGGTEASLTAYRFAVSDLCPPMHEADFQLDIYVNGTPYGSEDFSKLVGLPREDFELGDFSSYPWEFSGDASWTVASGGVNSGSYCSKSGAISDYDTTRMYVTLDITAPGDISFYYKVSSESNWDYLRFYIDDVQKAGWSGTVNWTEASYPVSAGEHTFMWAYEKDGSQSSGSDCGWVDFIVFPPTFQALSVATTSLPDWTEGQPYSQQLEAEGGTGNRTWSDLNDDLVGTGLTLSASGLLSGTPAAAGALGFTAHVVDQASGSADQPLSFTVNPTVSITTESLPDGEFETPYSQQLTSSGGTGAKTWSDQSDDLAAFGLSLSTSGLISGTPSTGGTVSFTAVATDITGASDDEELGFEIAGAYVCGDADGNGMINISDAVYLIAFIFSSGSAPDPLLSGDANCDGFVSISDAVYLIAYIFGGGPAPCTDCD